MIKDILEKFKERDFIVINNIKYSYGHALLEYLDIEKNMNEMIMHEKIVAIDGLINLKYVMLLFYLFDQQKIVVPLSDEMNKNSLVKAAYVEKIISISKNDIIVSRVASYGNNNNLINKLYENKHSGLILFSSGTTAQPKVILHDMNVFLDKYYSLGERYDIFLSVLRLTHIGGLNTLMYTLFTGSMIIITNNYNAKHICSQIEKYKVTVLPATPSFINLFLLTGEYNNYNLSSLKVISYGTEIMPDCILEKLNIIFPDIKIKQTYGLSEMGIFSTKSLSNNSLLFKLDGTKYLMKIVDGILYVKSPETMLGYLNADSPFDSEGWFNTQDLVEEYEGGYIKIKGRKSEIINVAGNKVYPSYIENILLGFEEIEDVTVIKGHHNVLGDYIVAKVKRREGQTEDLFKRQFYEFCKKNLERYQIPQKLVIVDEELHNARLKKIRKC